jgi:TM2 domain-containing membrane protein YozV
MSFFLCGLDQFYNNDIWKGVVMMAPLGICGLAASLEWHRESALIALFVPSSGSFVPFMLVTEFITRGVILLSISIFFSLGLLLSWVLWSIIGGSYIVLTHPEMTTPTPPPGSELNIEVWLGVLALLIVAAVWMWSVNDAYVVAQETNTAAGLTSPRNKAEVAVVLSLLWCGAGQIYNREFVKGFTMSGAMSLCLVSMPMWLLGSFLQSMASLPDSKTPSGLWLQVVGVIALVAAIALWLWGIVDAWGSATNH